MRWAKIALAGLLIICIAALCHVDRDAEWYRNYVRRNGSVLAEIGEELSLQEKWLLWRGAVDSMNLEDDRNLFFLKHAPLEGHFMLVYAPETAYAPSCLDFYDNWKLVHEESAHLRWEGGMDGKAFVDLYILGEGFYLEEAYLPT